LPIVAWPRRSVGPEPALPIVAWPRRSVRTEPALSIVTRPRRSVRTEPALPIVAWPRRSIGPEPTRTIVTRPRRSVGPEPALPIVMRARRPIGREAALTLAALTVVSYQPVLEAAALLVARNLEPIARIAVFPARPPVAIAPLFLRPACLRHLFFGRIPQPSAREPLHHDVWMLRLQLLERRLQFFLRVRAESGRLSLEDDRPVSVAWRHG
jgi:hypothetical protein